MIQQGIQTLVIRFPRTVLILLFLLTVLAGMYLPGLTADPSPRLLAPEHPARVASEAMRQTFTGSRSGIMVMLSVEGTDQDTVFNPQTLARIRDLSQAFERIHLITPEDREALENAAQKAPEEIAHAVARLVQAPVDQETWMLLQDIRDSLEFSDTPLPELAAQLDRWEARINPIKKVSSLAASDNILARNGELVVDPIFEDLPATPTDQDRLRREVTTNPLFLPILVSNLDRNTSINIELNIEEDGEETQKEYLIYSQVRDLVHHVFPGPETAYIAGFPSVTAALGKAMKTDSRIMFAAVTLIVIACLWITFKGIKGVAMPLTVVLLSLVVTLGIMAFSQTPLNIITISLPVFILSIGVADGIHMYSEYRDHILAGATREEAVRLTLDHLTLPVIMTSLTTGAAFYAISITKIIQLHHCGLYVCLGALVAMVFSLLFIPALLLVLPENQAPRKRHTQEGPDSAYTRALLTLTRSVTARPRITLALGAALVVVFAAGATRVKVDNNCVAFFKPDSDIHISSTALNQDGAGSSRINFLLDLDGGDSFKSPARLAQVQAFMDFVSAQPEVGKIMGLPPLVQRIFHVLNDQAPAFDRLPVDPDKDPVTPNLISQLLLLYETGGGDTLSDITTPDYAKLNLPAVLRTNSSLETKYFTDRLEAWARDHLDSDLRLTITGTANVEAATTKEIVTGQITGLTVSILVVLVMLGFTFRHPGYTLLAMVPLVATITINFGVMGFFNIPLDIGTAIIASVVIGIGVDYSIHYLSRLRAGLARGESFDQALDTTVRHSGKAIVSNALTVGAGFLALWFATLTPLMIMGWLITLTMAVSALSALVFLPVLVKITRPQPLTESLDSPVSRSLS